MSRIRLELILEAVAASCAYFGAPPKQGMITFVDPEKTRRKRDPGRCYRKAGFTVVGETAKDGLVALQLAPGNMPMGLGALPMFDAQAQQLLSLVRESAPRVAALDKVLAPIFRRPGTLR